MNSISLFQTIKQVRQVFKKKSAPNPVQLRPALVGTPPKPTGSKVPILPKGTQPPSGRVSRKVADTNDGSALPAQVHQLPPLKILRLGDENRAYNPNMARQAKILEETLVSFDIPARVVETNPGPTVTQFGVALGVREKKMRDGTIRNQRVRVGKVASLASDLALALSASPIRIEAPIPGRPIIGIEVPNAGKSIVSLRGVLAEPGFHTNKKPLQMALGRGASGDAQTAPLPKMPHLLIAGATGSGKSVCINALICSMLFNHGPEQLRLLMIDPKMVELTSYNGIPHLIAPVVTDFEQVVGALAWATREMEDRYKAFANIGARSITSYNEKVSPNEKLPYIVVVIDELADLMMMAPDEVERHICRLAQMARATGIHLMIATQRPSVDVITGLIKANFPARIAFAVTSQTDSRVILDTQGAEKLIGQGDMLYMSPDSSKLVRLQGCFVSDEEIDQLVRYWKTKTQDAGEGEGDAPHGKLPWTDILAENEKDDMLEAAIKLVVETQRASANYLRQRLGIGYTRASRLLDQLEDKGVVGPAAGSKGREVLWNDLPVHTE